MFSRRCFLAALGLAPVAAVSPAASEPPKTRVHTWDIRTDGANADPREIAREVARVWNSNPSLRPKF